MFDPEFKRFYQNVKDPDWPDIEEYREFVRLPPEIKHECREVHGLTTMLDQICDPNHWKFNLGLSGVASVYQLNDIAFVPVPKCGSIYYATKFNDMGWQRVPIKDINPESTRLFGFVTHPLNRYLKGITQLLVRAYSEPIIDKIVHWGYQYDTDWPRLFEALESRYFLDLVKNIMVGDIHSTPYHDMFGDLFHKIHWIPMDLFDDDQLKLQVMEFGQEHGQEINLTLGDQRIHQSTPDQLKVYHTIRSSFFKDSHIYQFYQVFGRDLRFYYQLLDKFSS